MKHETEILVCSYDSYDDVWPAFFTLFFRYWPDCPYQVNLLANTKSYPDERVRTLHTPATADWSTSFLDALGQMSSRNVIVLMEDYLLPRCVDSVRVAELIGVMEAERAACIHIFPDPVPTHELPRHPGVGAIEPGTPFRVNLQAAAWNREVLMSLIKPGESGWDFEVEGSRRSNALRQPFLSLTCSEAEAPFLYYRTGVVRGEWMPGAIRLCRREGIRLDLSRRRVGWLRGLARDTPALYPLRVAYVWVRRRLGKN